MKQFSNAVNNITRLAIAVFAVCALNAHAQNNPEAQNSIQSISVSGAQDGKLVIKVEMMNPLAKPPTGFAINTPPRIAFDFPNMANGSGKTVQEFGEGDLRSANIVQAGKRTRFVINLNQMLPYDTRMEGNNLLITLQAKAADTTVADVSPFAKATPTAQKYSLRDIDFHRGKNGEGRIQVDLSDPNIGIDIKQQGKSLIVDFTKTGLPRNLQHRLDVTDFGTPVESVDTFVQGDDVRMVIEPKGSWEQAAYQTDNKFIVEIKPLADDPDKLVKSSKAAYAGEKLTLNFQNILVREALYVLSDFINSNGIPMNIILSESVSGNITLRLKDVPWDQALDIILQSKGLDKRMSGNVLQIAPREELIAKEKLSLTASQDISELEALHTESFQLSYQKGSDVVAILHGRTSDAGSASSGTNTAASSSLLSKRGSVVVDQRTNTLFVKDTPSNLEEVRKMIKQIDVPVRQVMIEARFVNAKTNFAQNIGGKLGYTGPRPNVGTGTPLGGAGFQGLLFPTAGLSTPASTLFSAGDYGGATLQLFNAASTKVLQLELAAAENDGVQQNIASPRVVTADSTEASISQGQSIPYVTITTAGSTPTTTFAQANLSLKVTPKITPDDHVNMKVDISNDTQGAMTNAGPIINTNKITTQALVENGGTVVIGGVYSLNELDNVSKVPLLGDIPVLGWLFKNQDKSKDKTELLIFITPKILKDALNLR